VEKKKKKKKGVRKEGGRKEGKDAKSDSRLFALIHLTCLPGKGNRAQKERRKVGKGGKKRGIGGGGRRRLFFLSVDSSSEVSRRRDTFEHRKKEGSKRKGRGKEKGGRDKGMRRQALSAFLLSSCSLDRVSLSGMVVLSTGGREGTFKGKKGGGERANDRGCPFSCACNGTWWAFAIDSEKGRMISRQLITVRMQGKKEKRKRRRKGGEDGTLRRDLVTSLVSNRLKRGREEEGGGKRKSIPYQKFLPSFCPSAVSWERGKGKKKAFKGRGRKKGREVGPTSTSCS